MRKPLKYKVREFRKMRAFYSSKVSGFKLNLHYPRRTFISFYDYDRKRYW